jgi:hypothetical protein
VGSSRPPLPARAVNAGLLGLLCRHVLAIVLLFPGASERQILRQCHTSPPGDVRALLRWLVAVGVLRREFRLVDDAPPRPSLFASDFALIERAGGAAAAAAETGAETLAEELASSVGISIPASSAASSSSSSSSSASAGIRFPSLEDLVCLWESSHWLGRAGRTAQQALDEDGPDAFPSDPCPIPRLWTSFYAQPWCQQVMVRAVRALASRHAEEEEEEEKAGEEGGEEGGKKKEMEEDEEIDEAGAGDGKKKKAAAVAADAEEEEMAM